MGEGSITGQRIPVSLKNKAKKLQDSFRAKGLRISLSQAYEMIGDNWSARENDLMPFLDSLIGNKRRKRK